MKVTNPHPTRALLVVLAVAALAASLLMLVAAGKPAQAAFPGGNGVIAFLSDRHSPRDANDRVTATNDEIYVMNPDDSNNPKRLTNTPDPFDPYYFNELPIDSDPAVSPNGKEIVFLSDRDSKRDVDAGLKSTNTECPPGEIPVKTADSTADSAIYSCWFRNTEIYVMDAKDDDGDGNGDNLRRLTYNRVDDTNPTWSPDGKKIAFASTRDSIKEVGPSAARLEIYVMEADGLLNADGTAEEKTPTRLTKDPTRFDAEPVFSPNGTQIAFRSQRDGNGEIYVMDAKDDNGDGNGDNLLNLTKNSSTERQPQFSPDGKKMVFTSNRWLANFDIWVMDLTVDNGAVKGASNPINVNNSSAKDRWPTWSPDGTKIAFWRGENDLGWDGDIWVMDAKDGSNPTNLTDNNARGVGDIHPDWGPLADTTPPEFITVPSDISQTATSSSGNQVTFTAPTANDNVDGSITPTCDHNSGDTFSLGTTQVTCTATDKAGNTSTKSFNVTITYAWSDVLQPMNSDASSIFKLGGVVPVKFQLTGDSAGITDATAKLYIAQVSGDVTGTEQEATSNSSADSGNTFRYDSTNKQYVFNLATKNLSAGTWQLRIDLGDGVKHTVNISLKS